MKPKASNSDASALKRVRGWPERRCPDCQSDKWVHLESEKTEFKVNPTSGAEEKIQVPARYGCAKCGREFFVEQSLNWKKAVDRKRCPHCNSLKTLVAIEVNHGAVIACKHCRQLARFEEPGFEGAVTVETVAAAGKLTDEATEHFGHLGVRFEIRRNKRNSGGAISRRTPGESKPAA